MSDTCTYPGCDEKATGRVMYGGGLPACDEHQDC